MPNPGQNEDHYRMKYMEALENCVSMSETIKQDKEKVNAATQSLLMMERENQKIRNILLEMCTNVHALASATTDKLRKRAKRMPAITSAADALVISAVPAGFLQTLDEVSEKHVSEITSYIKELARFTRETPVLDPIAAPAPRVPAPAPPVHVPVPAAPSFGQNGNAPAGAAVDPEYDMMQNGADFDDQEVADPDTDEDMSPAPELNDDGRPRLVLQSRPIAPAPSAAAAGPSNGRGIKLATAPGQHGALNPADEALDPILREPMTAWPQLFRKLYPGQISCLHKAQRELINMLVRTFLVEQVGERVAELCVPPQDRAKLLADGRRPVYAIPESLMGQFLHWIRPKMDELVPSEEFKRPARGAKGTPPLPLGRRPVANPADVAASAAAAAAASVSASGMKRKATDDPGQDRGAPFARPMPQSAAEAGSEPHDPNVTHTAWMDVVRERHPSLQKITARMSLFARSFAEQMKIPLVRVNSTSSKSKGPSVGLPEHWHDVFTQAFVVKFFKDGVGFADPPVLKRAAAAAAAAAAAGDGLDLSDSIITADVAAGANSHHYLDRYLPPDPDANVPGTDWLELVKRRFATVLRDTAEDAKGLARMRNGVKTFLTSRGISSASRRVPALLENDFEEWFEKAAVEGFAGYDEGAALYPASLAEKIADVRPREEVPVQKEPAAAGGAVGGMTIERDDVGA
ncbi:hypothetical protein HK101_005635, partial [Irineochytrium annulatum]